MSEFTEACQRQATAAWGATASFANMYAKRNEGRSVGERANTGCLGLLVFWMPLFIVLFTFFIAIEAVIVAYALLASALWGVGAAVDAIRNRRTPPPPR